MYLKDLRLDNIELKDAVIYHEGREKRFEELFSKSIPIKGKRYSNDGPQRINSFSGDYLTI